MPTASTSQILGQREGCEVMTSNIYSRRILAGYFPVVNAYLVRDLIGLGLWNTDTRNCILRDRDSVQQLPTLPQAYKDLYKTVWEVKQRRIVEMAAERGAFIDQSQSMNIHLAEPTHGKITAMLFLGWELQNKCGVYYLRTRPKADPIPFTLDLPVIPPQVRPNSVDTWTETSSSGGWVEEEGESLW